MELIMKKFIFSIVLILTAAIDLFSAPSINELMANIDLRMEQIGDMSAKIAMTQKKASQASPKHFEFLWFRKDKTDEFLMITTAPDSDKGNGYLRVGENFWMYRQNTRTFQHISRDESILGTDTKSGDFERKKLTQLYKPLLDASGKEVISEEMLGKKPVYKFTIVAKVSDVTYPKQTYWVQKDNFLILKSQSYSRDGTLMQSGYSTKYTEKDGRFIPIYQIFVDEFEKGNKTIVEISGISFANLDRRIFTKAYLENLSK
jgi:outer membrane lipoprotein-sorting protein